MKKINIALIPQTRSADVVHCASHFSEIADRYFLSETSLPHVTLHQLYINEDDIQALVAKINASGVRQSIVLAFDSFSCVTFDGVTHWASLMPDKFDELHQMHKIIAEVISLPVKSHYDPHMTLMSTKQKNYESMVENVKKAYTTIEDTFVLSVGYSDEIGQYLEAIHRFHDTSN